MGIIELEGMEFYAYHGCFKAEQIVGNKFLMHLRMEYDATKASQSDKVEDALNYQIVYEKLQAEMQITSHLLEHVCERILNMLYLNFKEIKHATIKLSKLNPPLGGKMNCVSLTMSR